MLFRVTLSLLIAAFLVPSDRWSLTTVGLVLLAVLGMEYLARLVGLARGPRAPRPRRGLRDPEPAPPAPEPVDPGPAPSPAREDSPVRTVPRVSGPRGGNPWQT